MYFGVLWVAEFGAYVKSLFSSFSLCFFFWGRLWEMVTGIWWRNLAYFLAGFAALGVLGFAALFVPNLVYLVARFGVLAGVLGVLGFLYFL